MSPACGLQVPVTFFYFAKAKWKNAFTFSRKHQDVFRMFLQLSQILEEAFSVAFWMPDRCLLKQGLKTHVTHCTDAIICWVSVHPSDMCLFFSCHWCHFTYSSDMSDIGFLLKCHLDALKIRELQYSCNEWHEFWTLKKMGKPCLLINKKGCKNDEFCILW